MVSDMSARVAATRGGTRLRAFLESNGDSVVVIEDDDVANCHVHTSDPGMMLSEAIKYGYLTDFKIEIQRSTLCTVVE